MQWDSRLDGCNYLQWNPINRHGDANQTVNAADRCARTEITIPNSGHRYPNEIYEVRIFGKGALWCFNREDETCKKQEDREHWQNDRHNNKTHFWNEVSKYSTKYTHSTWVQLSSNASVTFENRHATESAFTVTHCTVAKIAQSQTWWGNCAQTQGCQVC